MRTGAVALRLAPLLLRLMRLLLKRWACRTSAATTNDAAMVGVPHQRCHDVLHDGRGCDGGHAAQALPQQTMLQRMMAVPHQ